MSNDPKKPLDAVPHETPELLQKDLSLDRRQRPTREELAALAPTEPERPFAPRPPPKVTTLERHLDEVHVPTVVKRVPQPTSLPQPPRSAPATVAARPTAPPPVAPNSTSTGVLPPRAPPSPTQWAEQQQQGRTPAMPVVTPMQANHGATSPASQARTVAPPGLVRASSPRAPAMATPMPVPQAMPLPQPARVPAPPPIDPSYREGSNVVPPHLLVTQPGMPGPFAKRPSPPPGPASPSEQPKPAAKRPEPRPSVTTVKAAPAGFVRRVIAWLVDLSVIGGLAGLFVLAAAAAIAPKGVGLQHSLMRVALPAALLAGVLSFVYTTLFAFLFRGRTPGRRLAGIHLVDGSGEAPGAGRALLRASLSLVSFGLFLSGFWLALFDRRGQTLHDKLTRTFVVRLLDA